MLVTGWWRPTGCLNLQVIFWKRTTNYGAFLREMTYIDKASNGSLPPCTLHVKKKISYQKSAINTDDYRLLVNIFYTITTAQMSTVAFRHCSTAQKSDLEVRSTSQKSEKYFSKRTLFEKYCSKIWSRGTLHVCVLQCVAVCCSVLQCVAVCCNVLQCVAVCCSVLQCVAVYCRVLQYIAVCCNTLQGVAVSCRVTRELTCYGHVFLYQ